MPGRRDQAGYRARPRQDGCEINTEYAAKWPNITAKKEPPADAKAFDGEDGKFEKFFSAEPGEGD